MEYFRSISGEHPDWDEYREAMGTRTSPAAHHADPLGPGRHRRLPRSARRVADARRPRVAPMLRIGLSGGIGSGKSTVAQHLASLGAVVIDADPAGPRGGRDRQ